MKTHPGGLADQHECPPHPRLGHLLCGAPCSSGAGIPMAHAAPTSIIYALVWWCHVDVAQNSKVLKGFFWLKSVPIVRSDTSVSWVWFLCILIPVFTLACLTILTSANFTPACLTILELLHRPRPAWLHFCLILELYLLSKTLITMSRSWQFLSLSFNL